jgi:hypothetical protein
LPEIAGYIEITPLQGKEELATPEKGFGKTSQVVVLDLRRNACSYVC